MRNLTLVKTTDGPIKTGSFNSTPENTETLF